jgi:glutamyl-tRNA synthetase
VKEIITAVLDALNSDEEFSLDSAKDLIKTVTKTANVKKGLVMKSMRAALTGALQGPDLMQSWVLLHQQGRDRTRLQQTLAHLDA